MDDRAGNADAQAFGWWEHLCISGHRWSSVVIGGHRWSSVDSEAFGWWEHGVEVWNA